MRAAGAVDFHRTDEGLFARRTAERGIWAEAQQMQRLRDRKLCEPRGGWRSTWRGHSEFTLRGGERGNGGVWGEANEDQVEAPVGVKAK